MAAAAVWIAFSLVIWTMNYVTDALTLKIIWDQQIRDVAITATFFMVLSGLFACGLIPRSIYVLRKDKRHDVTSLTVLRGLQLLLGSIPQLIFNFYSMSTCGETVVYTAATTAAANATATTTVASTEASGSDGVSSLGGQKTIDPIQIFSAIVSCIDISFCFILLDIKCYNVEKKSDDDKNKCACNRNSATVCIVRILALTARIFALAYFVFYLEWWIFLYLGIRWTLMTSLVGCIRLLELDSGPKPKIREESPLFVMLIVLWFYREGKSTRCLCCAFFYAAENGILFGITYWYNTYLRPGVEYCLFPNTNLIALHASLNALYVIIAIINKVSSHNDDD